MVDKSLKYGGLSRREFEMRKKMAAKFGRNTAQIEQEPQFDIDQLYKQLTVQTPLKIPQSHSQQL